VPRRRLDTELVRRGLAASRTEAQDAVRSGLVTVAGNPATNISTMVAPGEPVDLRPAVERFVSRGGRKLEAALTRFAIDVTERRCLDAGASTGGFTDCLLRRGAAHVTAVDVGYGQLAWSLRTSERVTVLERTNVRELTVARLGHRPDVIVADLSFISLRLVVPALARVARPGATAVLLVKPQFEAAPTEVGDGGVVGDPEVWRRAIDSVAAACLAAGFGPKGLMASPLVGPAGNVEFLLHARAGEGAERIDVEAALAEGAELVR
jgi:23S rRNA (cytidine1920-2'-O)/16S rRNA (cytidine1409-2'-O)-methyltransferase